MADKDKKKGIRVSIGLSWIYIPLLLGIIWMLFNPSGGNPQKEEWEDVKEQWLACDIKEITFIRNEYEGHVTIKPDKLYKYEAACAGRGPKKSPHFVFVVSGS